MDLGDSSTCEIQSPFPRSNTPSVAVQICAKIAGVGLNGPIRDQGVVDK